MCEHSYNMNTPLAISIISHPRCAGYRETAPHSTGINREWKDCTFQCACLKPQHGWAEETHSLGIYPSRSWHAQSAVCHSDKILEMNNLEEGNTSFDGRFQRFQSFVSCSVGPVGESEDQGTLSGAKLLASWWQEMKHSLHLQPCSIPKAC